MGESGRQVPPRPGRAEIAAAEGREVPDLIAPGLDILFCGINPGLYSGVTGTHFARPGNRFWPALHASGLTGRLLAPHEGEAMLALGYGITNLVERATAGAAELSPAELVAGGERLREKVRQYEPRCVAFLGLTAYRRAFARPRATVGEQAERWGQTRLWLLPNPSGLNAHFPPAELARVFGEMREGLRPENRE